MESTAVKTAIMAKMPMVIPRSDNNVLRRFTRKAFRANTTLSLRSVRKIMLKVKCFPFANAI
jgi:hypothetical protein